MFGCISFDYRNVFRRGRVLMNRKPLLQLLLFGCIE